MEQIKSFDEFKNQIQESTDVNEGLISSIKGAIKKVGKLFTGIGSGFLNALISQKEHKLKDGLTIYPSKFDIELMHKNGISITMPKLPSIHENLNSEFKNYVFNEEAIKNFSLKTNINESMSNEKHPAFVDKETLKDFIAVTIEAGKKSVPLIIWGPPGQAKTELVNQVVKTYGKRLIDYDLMTMSADDFFVPGLINKTENDQIDSNTRSSRLPDEFLPLYKQGDEEGKKAADGPDGKGGVLFLDEIARAPAKVKNVCLKLLNERRVGSWILGDNWVIVAACNRESDEDESNTYSWTSTLTNRVKMVSFELKYEEWQQWAKDAKDDDTGDHVIDVEIMTFLNTYKDKYFYKFEPQHATSPWPSGRSWTKASSDIYHWKEMRSKQGKEMSDKDLQAILNSTVGEEAATTFMGFRDLIKKVKPEDIKKIFKDGKNGPSWEGKKIDQLNALITAACIYSNNKKITEDEIENYVEWIISNRHNDKVPGGTAVIMALAIQAINMAHPELKNPKGSKLEVFYHEELLARLFDTYDQLKG